MPICRRFRCVPRGETIRFKAQVKGTFMDFQTSAQGSCGRTASYELVFASLYNPGRGVAVPCDEAGRVDLDAMTERLRNAYLGARAMVGREYLFPTVKRLH